MCSRYSLTSPHEAVRAVFKTVRGHDYPPRYNIAPTQPVAIVRIGSDSQRELDLVRWGLIPGWVKDTANFATLINARAETVLEKASFKAAMRHRRCIIPADAFYEWTGRPGARQPFMAQRAEAPSLMALAGLWEHWLGADGSEIETMAIITVPANPDLARIHDRMPAILSSDAYDPWLDVRGVKDREAYALLRTAPATALRVERLLPAINSPRLEGVHLQTRAEGTSGPG